MYVEDTLMLWEWEHTSNDGPIEYNDSSIYFKENERQGHALYGNAMVRGRILTSNPVGKYFDTFFVTLEEQEVDNLFKQKFCDTIR